MSTTQDPQTYRHRWNQHIDDLHGIGHTLNDPDRLADLLEHIDGLKEVVAAASEEL